MAEIETRLPHGASVFQLPYVPFPEGYPDTPIGDSVAAYATKYEPLRLPALDDAALELRGDEGPARRLGGRSLPARPLVLVEAARHGRRLRRAVARPSGFEPPRARSVLASLRATLGAPLLSPDRDLEFFDLRPLRRRLLKRYGPARLAALGERILHPPHPVRTGCATPAPAPLDPALTPFLPSPGDRTGAIVVGLTGPPCPG